MRRSWIAPSLVCLLVTGASAELTAQPARPRAACRQITAACENAGFTRGNAKGGNGLMVDCVRPIMEGASQPRRAGRPLPQVDPQLVEACKAGSPDFGEARRGEPAQPETQTPPVVQPTQVAPQQQPQARANGERRPNIIFILTDDLAINLVQYMPHVVQMQKDGVTFANYFVTDSLCCPSRSSIFTGRFPHDTGIFKNEGADGGYLAFESRGNQQATFATALTAAGYRTAMLGKYLNGYQPPRHGPDPGWSSWSVAGNGYPEFNYALNEDGMVVRFGNGPNDYLTDVASGIASRFIRQSAGSPFVVEVATFAPHAPYTPAPRDADKFPNLRAPRTAAFNVQPDPNAPTWLQKLPPLGPRDMEMIDTDFRKRAQSVQAVDALIGELQAAVAAIGQKDNTYFVFSSDNGYHMGEHRMRPGKMTAFDTDIHVPLIITGPGVPAGRTVEEIAENIDLCPTFADIGGASLAPNVDGRSLLPLLHGEKPSTWRSAALIEHHGPVKSPTDPDMPVRRGGNPPSYEAIRMANSVYVEYVTGEKEYYDIAADPDELHNTFGSLPAGTKGSLHALLTGLEQCHSAQACTEADQSARSAMRK
jgi:N-acetylglucosamine-6-sulfatase